MTLQPLLNIFEERVVWRRKLAKYETVRGAVNESEYSEREIDQLFFLTLNEITGLPKSRLLAENEFPISSIDLFRIHEILDRLLLNEPIQYILGYTQFLKYRFHVNKFVLIPRPETEELVLWVLEVIENELDLRSGLQSRLESKLEYSIFLEENSNGGIRILDIGTGSGCIAISLYFECKRIWLSRSDTSFNSSQDGLSEGYSGILRAFPKIYGIDISAEALSVARSNQLYLGSEVMFIEDDILQYLNGNSSIGGESSAISDQFLPGLDLIISNPPYVPISEEKVMSLRVKNYEPSLALFVPEEDPLKFYRAIFAFAQVHLVATGFIFLEIHENYGLIMNDLADEYGFKVVEMRQDFLGKDRMMCLKKR